jgi:hypothetical protein
MDYCARSRGADPLRIAAGGGDPAIERGRELENSEWTPAGDARDKSFVEGAALIFENSGFDRDSGPP